MKYSKEQKALILAAYYRGGDIADNPVRACTDQVIVLSNYFTETISLDDTLHSLQHKGHVTGIHDDEGELLPLNEKRYYILIDLVRQDPDVVEGLGNWGNEVKELPPSDVHFNSVRLKEKGLEIAKTYKDEFPPVPNFPEWPNRRE